MIAAVFSYTGGRIVVHPAFSLISKVSNANTPA
jgi:hypothetical protein